MWNPAKILITVDSTLFIVFLAVFAWTIRALPPDAVKLRGTVDAGVDLLGTRGELWWIAAFAAAVFFGNTILALLLRRTERIASLFLLATTIPILLLATTALFVVIALNL